MGLMIDTDLRAQVGAAQLMDGVDLTNLAKQVRGCAVEMRIGDIFRPGSDPQKPGSAGHPRERYALSEGETAVVRTIESFKLGDSHTALVLPVSSVSLQGLLMTNPGQVDPGYQGQLHVTVINMGRQPFMLKKGDRLLRALIFKLDQPVSSLYQAPTAAPGTASPPNAPSKRDQLLRTLICKLDEVASARSQKPSGGRSPINEELLDTLSPDFLSVSARGTAAAKREIDAAVRSNAVWQYFFPAIVAAVSALGAAWFTNHSLTKDFERRIADMEKQAQQANADLRLRKLESDFPTEKRLNSIEEILRQIKREQERTTPR